MTTCKEIEAEVLRLHYEVEQYIKSEDHLACLARGYSQEISEAQKRLEDIEIARAENRGKRHRACVDLSDARARYVAAEYKESVNQEP